MNIKDFLLGYEAGAAQGGGSSADVRYVTFMSHDGTVELGKKAVAVGDDCADPIARGVFDTPTKESTAQYNYSFVGWATSPNGAWDEAAHDAVSEDRTVFAAYAAAVRYYTITFYDDDGTTVLKTQSLAYGAMPSFTPTKENYLFVEWSPELATVTGAANYTAVWEEKITFYSGSWEKIAAICASGNAANVFTVGDCKPVTLTYKDGTSETIWFRIVGMNKDADENGEYWPLTCMADNLLKDDLKPASAYNKGDTDFYDMDNAKTRMAELFAALPAELQEVIKPKLYNSVWKATTKVFIPSRMGLFGTNSAYANPTYPKSQYQWFASGNSKWCAKLGTSTDYDYWLDSVKSATSSNYTTACYDVVSNESILGSSENPTSVSHGIRLCFCI